MHLEVHVKASCSPTQNCLNWNNCPSETLSIFVAALWLLHPADENANELSHRTAPPRSPMLLQFHEISYCEQCFRNNNVTYVKKTAFGDHFYRPLKIASSFWGINFSVKHLGLAGLWKTETLCLTYFSKLLSSAACPPNIKINRLDGAAPCLLAPVCRVLFYFWNHVKWGKKNQRKIKKTRPV